MDLFCENVTLACLLFGSGLQSCFAILSCILKSACVIVLELGSTEYLHGEMLL